ncbi:MAG: NADH-quinone oxidoreductase subunit N, partial [Actinobacteria bacterium]
MTGYALLIPEAVLVIGTAWAMFADRLPGRDRGSAWVGAACAAAAAVFAALAPAGIVMFDGLLVIDPAARFARTAIALVAALWLVWIAGRTTWRVREAVALSLLATTGALLMTEAVELITLVLAVELATLPAYVLIGYRKHRIAGLEGALKYFLLSMLTTLVMLYGMSFLYGVAGSTRYGAFDVAGSTTLGLLAVLLTFIGLFAKLSAAPFHYWAPDAYEG